MELEKIELQSIYNFTIEHDYDAVCICDLNSGDYVMSFCRLLRSLRLAAAWQH